MVDLPPVYEQCVVDDHEVVSWRYTLDEPRDDSSSVTPRVFTSGLTARARDSLYDKHGSLCLKAAHGEHSLRKGFSAGAVLHIGVCSHGGRSVCHLDQDGVARVSAERWGHTLVIPVRALGMEMQENWEQLLTAFLERKQAQEAKHRRRHGRGIYDEVSYNCFHFVAEFLGVTRSFLVANCVAVRLGQLERYHLAWKLLAKGKTLSAEVPVRALQGRASKCWCGGVPSRFCLGCDAQFCPRCVATLGRVDFRQHLATHSILRDIWK